MTLRDHIVEVRRNDEVRDRALFEWTILDGKRMPISTGKVSRDLYATKREAAAAGARVLGLMRERK